MDHILLQLLNGDIFPYDQEPEPESAAAPAVPQQTSFAPYRTIPENELGIEKSERSSNSGNINKRIIEFLRRNNNNSSVLPETREIEKERCFRHMMNERNRRERQKRSYSDLHSVLPFGTKSDKNSVVQTAANRVQELKLQVEELERRNQELEENGGGGKKIRVRIANPNSGIDSMVEVLRCLKKMNMKSRRIQSNFSKQELVADIEMESKVGVGAKEVEKAVEEMLRKLEHAW